MTNPRKALVYALMDLSRYEITQYGHRDAREKIANMIEKMIDERVEAALAGTYICELPGGPHEGSCPACGCRIIARKGKQ